MSKQHTRNTSYANQIKLLWIGLLIIGLLFGAVAYQLMKRIASNHRDYVTTDYIINYEQSKYSYCYDRDIVPCNDDAIWDWNNAHENDKFEFKRDQALGDEIDKVIDYHN